VPIGIRAQAADWAAAGTAGRRPTDPLRQLLTLTLPTLRLPTRPRPPGNTLILSESSVSPGGSDSPNATPTIGNTRSLPIGAE